MSANAQNDDLFDRWLWITTEGSFPAIYSTKVFANAMRDAKFSLHLAYACGRVSTVLYCTVAVRVLYSTVLYCRSVGVYSTRAHVHTNKRDAH
jgi:hypothetical protein